jgi:hypothetical protein
MAGLDPITLGKVPRLVSVGANRRFEGMEVVTIAFKIMPENVSRNNPFG